MISKAWTVINIWYNDTMASKLKLVLEEISFFLDLEQVKNRLR